MNPSVETQIWLALKARIETLPLQIVKLWPAEKSSPPTLPAGFLRIGRVTVAPNRQFIKDGQPYERTGALIITLVQPLLHDVAVYDNQAGNIAEHFKDGTKTRFGNVCVKVTSYPHVQEGYEDFGYWNVPISIPWRAFA